MTKNYSEADLQNIRDQIMDDSVPDTRVYLDHKKVPLDWDEKAFISEMYEDFLRACQQGQTNKATGARYGKSSTFEGFLQDARQQLTHRRDELTDEQSRGQIDLRTYNNAKMVTELADEAIAHYLERSATGRLIGV